MGSESFWLRTHGFQGNGTLGEGMEAWQPFFTFCRVHLFQLAVPELQAFIINQ